MIRFIRRVLWRLGLIRPSWKDWQDFYSPVSKEELLKQWRKSVQKTIYYPPLDDSDAGSTP